MQVFLYTTALVVLFRRDFCHDVPDVWQYVLAAMQHIELAALDV